MEFQTFQFGNFGGATCRNLFFLSECCGSTVRCPGGLPSVSKLSEKRRSSEMIGLSNKHCMYETRQTLERNTGQTAEGKEDSLTEGVKSNSVG